MACGEYAILFEKSFVGGTSDSRQFTIRLVPFQSLTVYVYFLPILATAVPSKWLTKTALYEKQPWMATGNRSIRFNASDLSYSTGELLKNFELSESSKLEIIESSIY